MKVCFSLILSVLFFFSYSRSQIVVSGSFQASSDGANVSLRWITQNETNIQHFEVERSSGTDGNFKYIATVNPKGPSVYQFIDYSAFRKISVVYQYRLKIVFSDGSKNVFIGPVSVNHTVSGVKRTWGSIKAMFR